MRLRLISDGTVAGTRIVGLESGLDYDSLSGTNPIDNVIGCTLERAYDAETKPLPYMLLNVTVRIDDEPAEPEQVHPLDMTD